MLSANRFPGVEAARLCRLVRRCTYIIRSISTAGGASLRLHTLSFNLSYVYNHALDEGLEVFFYFSLLLFRFFRYRHPAYRCDDNGRGGTIYPVHPVTGTGTPSGM